jgi:exopolyphosphatase / guanosine-5'-triphosphate,3'-diphosphate pyrophosphatase
VADRVRVAVIDLGSNSTRLLIADVADGGAISEVERRTKVTRLGHAVDGSGVLADDAMDRVLATLAEYREAIATRDVTRTAAVLTSAVRDAANGAAFTARVRDEYGLDARTLTGDEEAQLTFMGATSQRPGDDATPIVVIDIGGGSTEFVVGTGHEVSFHVSTQAGVVRHTERHLATDPPTPAELGALADDVRAILAANVPPEVRQSAAAAIAVAGTATSLAAIDLGLECYSPNKVHGHELSLEACRRMLAHLATLREAQRREVRGLHPDRAPTIVAGVVMLIEALTGFGLDRSEVSDQDILHGAALETVHRTRAESSHAATMSPPAST